VADKITEVKEDTVVIQHSINKAEGHLRELQNTFTTLEQLVRVASGPEGHSCSRVGHSASCLPLHSRVPLTHCLAWAGGGGPCGRRPYG
jgi:hypothetical protein